MFLLGDHLSAFDGNLFVGSTCVRGPATGGDSSSSLCIVLLTDEIYAFASTLNRLEHRAPLSRSLEEVLYKLSERCVIKTLLIRSFISDIYMVLPTTVRTLNQSFNPKLMSTTPPPFPVDLLLWIKSSEGLAHGPYAAA